MHFHSFAQALVTTLILLSGCFERVLSQVHYHGSVSQCMSCIRHASSSALSSCAAATSTRHRSSHRLDSVATEGKSRSSFTCFVCFCQEQIMLICTDDFCLNGVFLVLLDSSCRLIWPFSTVLGRHYELNVDWWQCGYGLAR